MGEFLVSADGARIHCERAAGASMESFQVYLLGQALSFALVKGGHEPLHGTAVVHNGEAIVLLGDSGFGKSTLAASFIAAGCPLLTDDLLLLRPSMSEQGEHSMTAYPGPPRIKLFPKIARRFLGSAAEGVPMNALTQKQVIPLGPSQRCTRPVPLRAIYVLAPPQEMRHTRRVHIQPLSAREAFLALIGNTFNRYIGDSARLQRQLVETTRLLRAVPVSKLSYPRLLARLSEVHEAILTDVADHPPNPPHRAASVSDRPVLQAVPA